MVKKMRKSRFWAFLGRKQYVIAGAIVIAAAVATTVIYSDHEQQQREQLEEELAQENTPEEAGLVAATESTEQTAQASAVIPPEQTAETEKLEQKAAETTESTEVAQVEKEAENETAETGAGVNALHFDPEDGMLWPMEGNVILNYSMDSTIYFATFSVFTNDLPKAKECLDDGEARMRYIAEFGEALSDIDEFFLMSACQNQIISNSTYSTWAAYLNTLPGRIVIVPKFHGVEQMALPDWIVLDGGACQKGEIDAV